MDTKDSNKLTKEEKKARDKAKGDARRKCQHNRKEKRKDDK